LCELSAERVGLDEVRERALAVDLDDGEPLAVTGFQLRVAADVDLLELELDLGTNCLDRTTRGLAQVAALGVVEDDVRYGYRPRVMVASETRWTASPYAASRIVVERDW
jgi:hypothetical protein